MQNVGSACVCVCACVACYVTIYKDIIYLFHIIYVCGVEIQLSCKTALNDVTGTGSSSDGATGRPTVVFKPFPNSRKVKTQQSFQQLTANEGLNGKTCWAPEWRIVVGFVLYGIVGFIRTNSNEQKKRFRRFLFHHLKAALRSLMWDLSQVTTVDLSFLPLAHPAEVLRGARHKSDRLKASWRFSQEFLAKKKKS